MERRIMERSFSYTVVYMTEGKVVTAVGLTTKAAQQVFNCPGCLVLTITLAAETENG